MKVLHVDDNIIFTETLSQLLRLHDHECEVSNDCKEALQMTLTNNYDVIILDLDMPDSTGYDYINELEEIGVISSQNIIVLTGSLPSQEKVQDMLKKGVETCVEKPISIEELTSMFASFAAKPSAK